MFPYVSPPDETASWLEEWWRREAMATALLKTSARMRSMIPGCTADVTPTEGFVSGRER